MSMRKKLVMAVVGAIAVVGTGLMTVPSAEALDLCGPSMHLGFKARLKDSRGNPGPAEIFLNWNSNETKACVTVKHTDIADGKRVFTAVGIESAYDRKYDGKVHPYNAGPLTVRVYRCVEIWGRINWKGTGYTFHEKGHCGGPGGAGVKPGGDDSPGNGVWDKLARCESGNTNNHGFPYYGYFQFSPATWHAVGGTGLPDQHDRAEQLKRAKMLQDRSGWGQWPNCARKLGLA